MGEKEESEVRELVLGAPSWGIKALVGHFWPKFPTTAPSPHLISPNVTALKAAPSPWSPQSLGTLLQSPFHWTFLKFPSFEYVLSFCQELIASLSESSVCSDTNISATLLLKLTLKKTVMSKLLQAVWKFFP